MEKSTDLIPTYHTTFIVLSYIISWIGCITTLELLQRRTSTKGAYNWYLLESATVTMAGCGIWSMHFVGNNAIFIDGDRLVYDSAWTTFSFFLPVIVLNAAFYILGTTESTASLVAVAIAGVLTGAAVCAMHYVGSLGLRNYACTYHTANVVGAVLIAIVASLIALTVFFRLRDTWTNSWWKRASCGAILAAAVAGMHWTAAVGTVYHAKPNIPSFLRHSKTSAPLIVTAVLSLGACIILLGFAMTTGHRAMNTKKSAQDLVLACAYFDRHGRLMVTSEGTLPFAKITSHFVERTFAEDEFDRSHPLFAWIYKASNNWATMRELIPMLQAQIGSDSNNRGCLLGCDEDTDDNTGSSSDYNDTFKKLFCLAAFKLSEFVDMPLEELGTLFEDPLETGTAKDNRLSQIVTMSMRSDPEKQVTPLSARGKYLFLTRQITKAESKLLSAQGYRFGLPEFVVDHLSRSMQVGHDEILTCIERMKYASSPEYLLPPGIHVGAFILRPGISKGFDILVPQKKQNQLPAVSLATKDPDAMHAYLSQFKDMEVQEILDKLLDGFASPEPERSYCLAFHESLASLANHVADIHSIMKAKFCATPVPVPCQGSTADQPLTCKVYAIRFLGTIHSVEPNENMTYAPLSFFDTQQLMISSVGAREKFERQVRVEFGLSIRITRDITVVSTDCDSHKRVIIPTSRSRSLFRRFDFNFGHPIWLNNTPIFRQRAAADDDIHHNCNDHNLDQSAADKLIDDSSTLSEKDRKASSARMMTERKRSSSNIPTIRSDRSRASVQQQSQSSGDSIRAMKTVTMGGDDRSFVIELLGSFKL